MYVHISTYLFMYTRIHVHYVQTICGMLSLVHVLVCIHVFFSQYSFIHDIYILLNFKQTKTVLPSCSLHHPTEFVSIRCLSICLVSRCWEIPMVFLSWTCIDCLEKNRKQVDQMYCTAMGCFRVSSWNETCKVRLSLCFSNHDNSPNRWASPTECCRCTMDKLVVDQTTCGKPKDTAERQMEWVKIWICHDCPLNCAPIASWSLWTHCVPTQR